jgi:hypothetical protein
VLRNLDNKPFEFLAGVLFTPDFAVSKAALIPHSVVIARSKYRAHVNGWLFHLEDHIWVVDGVRDVTDALRAAEADLNTRLIGLTRAAVAGDNLAG